MPIHGICGAVLAFLFALIAPVSRGNAAELPDRSTFNDFGNTGLLQMPNGRMAADGELALGASYISPYTRYYITSQILPWLQGTFRYTDIANRDYGPVSTTGQSYKDKGVDIKIRLFEEGQYLPEISLGLRDIGGTGLFSSEYLALSRRYYNWDFTAGLAWGNAGTRADFDNPLGQIDSRFDQRSVAAGTGSLTGSYFRGRSIGLFGGIEYRTPIEGLSLKLELDGNNYEMEPLGNRFDPSSRINVGLNYRPLSWVDFSLGFERGNEAMFRLTLRSNVKTDRGVPKIDERPPMPVAPRKQNDNVEALPVRTAIASDQIAIPPTPPRLSLGQEISDALDDPALDISSIDLRDNQITVRLKSVPNNQALQTAEERLQRVTASSVRRPIFIGPNGKKLKLSTKSRSNKESIDQQGKALFAALSQYGITGLRYFIDDDEATLIFSQGLYKDTGKPFGRAARVLANYAPAHVERFRLILSNGGLPVEQIALLRKDVERVDIGLSSADEAWLHASITPPQFPPRQDNEFEQSPYPEFDFGIMPHIRESIGGPDAFVLYQIYATPSVSVSLAPGLDLSGSLGVNIHSNFDKFNYRAPSNLPRVRTDLAEYLKESDFWINSLGMNYIFPIAPEWYGRASAGLFEQMYGGIDGEILYRPTGKRWALGLDINHAWQRDFSGGFGFRDYDVTTGQLTYYQMTPFYGVYYTLGAGRYLAGDIGGTITVGRRFENGVELGVWATKTNVSAAEFGEGSFDKGFYVSVPLDMFFTTPSKSRANFPFRPLIRDGGQTVERPASLFAATGGFDNLATQGSWRDLWR